METNNQGAPVPPVANNNVGNSGQQASASEDVAGSADPKVFSIVGYILPILFFLPLVMDQVKHNAFARFHANQQLLLVILSVAIMVLSNVIMGMFWTLPMLMPLAGLLQFVWLGVLALQVIGIINVSNDRMSPLPLIGHITIIK